MCIAPWIFILETHNQTNYKCLPKFVQTNNASSSKKNSHWALASWGSLNFEASTSLEILVPCYLQEVKRLFFPQKTPLWPFNFFTGHILPYHNIKPNLVNMNWNVFEGEKEVAAGQFQKKKNNSAQQKTAENKIRGAMGKKKTSNCFQLSLFRIFMITNSCPSYCLHNKNAKKINQLHQPQHPPPHLHERCFCNTLHATSSTDRTKTSEWWVVFNSGKWLRPMKTGTTAPGMGGG